MACPFELDEKFEIQRERSHMCRIRMPRARVRTRGHDRGRLDTIHVAEMYAAAICWIENSAFGYCLSSR